ncbi:MAG: Ig-like domain-containing protein [Kofleriaceae bacterium]
MRDRPFPTQQRRFYRVAGLLVVLAIASCGYAQPEDVAGAGDAPPTVVSVEPTPYAAEVAVDTPIRIRFSKPIAMSTAAVVVEAAGLPVEGTLSALERDTLEFTPTGALAKGMPYTVTVTKAADLADNAMEGPYTYDFTTVTTACVKPGGADGCFALLSAAVATVGAGASIAVAAGTYMDQVVVDKTLNLLGGYNDALTMRNPTANPTALRGNNRNASLIEIVTIGNAIPNATVVDGFTLTGHTLDDNHGAGLRVTASNPRIRNNVISSNTAYFLGGGVYVAGGLAHLARNRIEYNALLNGGNGGGVAIEQATVELVENVIVNNRIPAISEPGDGGGVGIVSSVVVLRRNQIEGNRASEQLEPGLGSGVSINASTVTIEGGTISLNGYPAVPRNAAGAGLHISAMSEVVVRGVTIHGNLSSTTSGGSGVHAENSKVTLASSIIALNRYGGAGLVLGPLGSYVVLNCTISGNMSKGMQVHSRFALVNSIIEHEALGVEAVAATPAVDSANKVENNVFFDAGADLMGLPLDLSNRKVDPQLDDAFHLTSGSPLIDAGRPGPVEDPVVVGRVIAPPDHDIDGDARSIVGIAGNSALPDIGADEYRP